jgi:hypothetical protein
VSSVLGDAAVAYARGGLLIFPVQEINKMPYVSQYRATSDADIVRAWWQEHPGALIGCRVASDVFVLDIDPRHGGDKTWELLDDTFGPIRIGRRHYSGRGDGGFHAWFVRPVWMARIGAKALDRWAQEHEVGAPIMEQGVVSRWTSGIDVLQYGHRYTILPPSPHSVTGQPYYWPPQGENGALVELPGEIARMLVLPEPQAPAPPSPNGPGVRLGTLLNPDSIADWFSETATWPGILTPRGWVCVEDRGDSGDGDGSLWRHPSATAAHSASVKYGCLFVYSPNTHFEPTGPDDKNGYTKFRAWAVLEHNGDLSAAAGAARSMRTPITAVDDDEDASTSPPPPPPPPPATLNLPGDFWAARPLLESIRSFAHSRTCSADAVYAAVRARFCALVPFALRIDTGVGVPVSLNSLTLIVGESGGGKSSAVEVAAELLPIVRKDVYVIPPGSGEGIAEAYFDLLPDPNYSGTGKAPRIKQRGDVTAVLADVDEGEVLMQIGGRQGTTLLSTLRAVYMGARFGQSNATQDTRRIIAPHSYRFALLAGFQPSVLIGLYAPEAVAGGTPQRFVLFAATDPSIDPQAALNGIPVIADPARLVLTARTRMSLVAGRSETVALRLAVSQRKRVLDPLDSHRNLNRIKEAAILALLDGRLSIEADDWTLAGMILDTSDAIRRWTLATKLRADAEQSQRQAVAKGRAAATSEVAQDQVLVAVMAERIRARLIAAGPAGVTRRVLARSLTSFASRHRFDPALDLAIANTWAVLDGDRVRVP